MIARPKLLDQFASEPAADQCKTGPNGGENGGGDLRLRRIRGSDGQAARVEGKDDPVHDSMDETDPFRTASLRQRGPIRPAKDRRRDSANETRSGHPIGESGEYLTSTQQPDKIKDNAGRQKSEWENY